MADASTSLRLVIPKGRIGPKVLDLLREAGYAIEGSERSYRPRCEADGVEVKVLKPQNIPQLLALGRHDLGFAGHDWVVEQGADVQEVLDLGLDRVRLVAAVPRALAERWSGLGRPLVVATEYTNLAAAFLAERRLRGVIVRTYGATEVFPPEDADLVIDNVSTGETLRQNGLVEIETLLASSTRMLVSPAVRDDPAKQERIEALRALIAGVLLARKKVLLEMNVPADRLDAVVAALPAMRAPTVSPLHQGAGYAVKVAVDRARVPALIAEIKSKGAIDVIEYNLGKIIP